MLPTHAVALSAPEALSTGVEAPFTGGRTPECPPLLITNIQQASLSLV